VQRAATRKLRDAVRELADKIELARHRRTLLVARLRRAEAHKRIHGTLQGVTDGSAVEAFERLDERVSQVEAEADAMAEIEAADDAPDALRREMADLERARRVEERMKEMRKGPSGATRAGDLA
jgi:phage shock protein A